MGSNEYLKPARVLKSHRLVRVIKSLTNSIDDVNRERSLVEEWRRVSRKGKTANGSELAVLQKLGDMTMAAAINRIAALKAEDYRLYVTKVSLDRTLAQIIEKQNIATCTEYFTRVKASLPQELQDIILGYIVDNGLTIDCETIYWASSLASSEMTAERNQLKC